MVESKRNVTAAASHSVSVDNRNKMNITGFLDVAAFSEEKVEILTTMGKLIVRGKKLNVNTLNTDSGELKLNGEIKSWDYTDNHKGGGLFAGLFS